MKTSAQRGSQACERSRVSGSFAVRRDRLFLRSGARRAANCGNAWFRGPSISGRAAQRFHARAASPPVRTRRLTFLKAGRGHTTSSSSAITIAKMDQRSCSITYQPRNCVDVLPLSCASKKDLTKMERGWLVPYRTLALDLCPQSIGRAPRLLASPVPGPARSQQAAKLHWHSAALTGREHSYVPFVAWRSSCGASCPKAPIARIAVDRYCA